MSITTAMTSVPKPAPDLIEAFRDAPTSVISDNLARLPGAVGLRPFHRGGRLVGTAFTVRTRPGDNLAIHRALELVGPGDVIVVDGGGDETRALVGEIMKNIAEHRGAAGYVIDGAIRDVAAFAASEFPCFARSAIHRGPYKSGPGEINVPVSIGGSVISPGDIVVGDEDGVVSFPASIAATVNFISRQPRVFAEMLGKMLWWCGEDKILYGGEAPIWHPQWALEEFWNFELPRDIVEERGYPQLTDQAKRKILGENLARLHGIDVDAKKAELGVPG